MKFIHAADLHIGRYLKDISLLDDQEDALNQLIQIINEESPDALVIAGDVYDRSVPREDAVRVYNSFLTRLAELGVNVFLITGNHDSSERVQVLNSLLETHGLLLQGHPEDPLKKVGIRDEFGEVSFYFLPYKDSFALREIYGLNESKDDSVLYDEIIRRSAAGDGNRKVLIFHGFVTPGVKEDMETSDSERLLTVGGTDFVMAEVFDIFDYVALGHLHKPQWVRKGKIRYSGSLMKYSFSEANHMKSISVVEMDKEGIVEVRERHITPLRDLVILKGSFSDLMNSPGENHAKDFVRAVITDTDEIQDPLERLRVRYPNIIELQRERDMQEEGASFAALEKMEARDVRSLFHEFYLLENGDEPSDEMVRIIDETVKEMGVTSDETYKA
ncbi:exonuclease SbcCD subunit D [Youngiibacter fragilis]|uniref:Nuclease SbcCD subunit D n=1 Tax=Youngiibacter fragilis 232.1 TaxID=994573 RepID=V7IAV8_9CLOT|nr:exonuclease SbcCD subunit D [Youngiibacter fragilis]ETA82441.1 exonuclease SbcD [Youngiibacter fragilis 232.1]